MPRRGSATIATPQTRHFGHHPEARTRVEQIEAVTLSKYAALSKDASGRARPMDPDPLRTSFQRDRDRVIHCKAFRRLKHKTQVFLAPVGDHYRTRLTHTMEVTQVARTIARALRLNEDLTEAIGLGHDIGHTPFGHAGEDALAQILGHFRHNEQSVRVARYVERDGEGLNLCEQVIDGMLKHSKSRDSVGAVSWGIANTLEGQVVKLSDSIAYIAHDIDDAMRAGVIAEGQIPREYHEAFGNSTGERIEALVCDVVDYNWGVAEDRGDRWQDAVGNGEALGHSPEVLRLMNGLREYMFQNVYTNSVAKVEEPKAKFIVQALFEYFLKNPTRMPAEFQANPREEPNETRVADYIAGMTDRYALAVFEDVYVPRAWHVLG